MALSPTGRVFLWFYSLVAAAVGGVGTAISVYISGQAIGAMNFTPRQIGAIALGGAITAAAAYLKSSPLPDLRDTYPGTTPTP